MAATATALPINAAAATPGGKRIVPKPERPDQDLFQKAVAAAEKEHEDVQQQLKDLSAELEAAEPDGSMASRRMELRNELAELRKKQATKKSSRAKLEDEIKALQGHISARVKELQTKRSSMPHRTLSELEAAVRQLEAKVETGAMKIVDEKRALQEISNLNRSKRKFPELDGLHASIEEDRAKLKALRERKQDPEADALSEKYNELDAELKAIKAEEDTVYQNLNRLRDERTHLQALQNDKWTAIRAIRDEFREARDNYRAYEREARRIRDARRAQEQAEYVLQKKRALAAQRMEAASQPAFAAEIITCEKLIAFFDPSSAEAARNARLAVAPRELAAKAITDTRQFESKKPMKVLERKGDDDFFVGSGGKKKKGKKPREDVAETSKIDLKLGVLEELARIDVPVPSSREEVPGVLDALRGKLQHYKDNQDKVTKGNIAKAQKEIEKLEMGSDHEPASSPPTNAAEKPATASRTATPAVEETRREEEEEQKQKEEGQGKDGEEENEEDEENKENEEKEKEGEEEGGEEKQEEKQEEREHGKEGKVEEVEEKKEGASAA